MAYHIQLWEIPVTGRQPPNMLQWRPSWYLMIGSQPTHPEIKWGDEADGTMTRRFPVP
jgi:hypothetical protein